MNPDHPVTLRLNSSAPCADLTGQRISMWYSIEHETEKAVLLKAMRKEGEEVREVKGYWFPKSQILVDGEHLPRRTTIELQGRPCKTMRIPGWLWAKKTPAAPMGCEVRHGK